MDETIKRLLIGRCVLRGHAHAVGLRAEQWNGLVPRRWLVHAVTTRKLRAQDLDGYLLDLPAWGDMLARPRGLRGRSGLWYWFEPGALDAAREHVARGTLARVAAGRVARLTSTATI